MPRVKPSEEPVTVHGVFVRVQGLPSHVMDAVDRTGAFAHQVELNKMVDHYLDQLEAAVMQAFGLTMVWEDDVVY